MSLHELFNAVIDYRVTAEGLGCAAVFVVVGLIGANMESNPRPVRSALPAASA